MEKSIVATDQNGIVWFTINRPDKRNAIDYHVMEALSKTLEEVENSKDVKALVITGEGNKAFCSGGDLASFHNLHTKEEAFGMLSKMGNILYKLLTLSKPTVALINGIAIGGGCELATACDFRLASTNSKLGFVQGTLGITTGWGGGTMLFEKVAYENALKLLVSAKVVTADEAKELGFVHEVDTSGDLKSFCEDYVEKHMVRNIEVLKAYKIVARRKWNVLKMKERMFEEIDTCASLWESDEHHQAVASFLQKK